jgi:hypothetical protein
LRISGIFDEARRDSRHTGRTSATAPDAHRGWPQGKPDLAKSMIDCCTRVERERPDAGQDADIAVRDHAAESRGQPQARALCSMT